MDLKALAISLGIENYPKKFEEIYNSIDVSTTELCSVDAVKKFDAEYNAFGDQLSVAIKGAEDIVTKPSLVAWLNVVARYLEDCSAEEAYQVPFPDEDTSPAGSTIRLFALMSAVPRCIRTFREHGFSDSEIFPTFKCFNLSISVVGLLTGTYGINKRYYNWLLHYILCEMFDHGSFNFQFLKMIYPFTVLKSKRDGSHVILMTEGVFHKSGEVLGSPGYTDEDGSFSADYAETDDAYIGRRAVYGKAVNELLEYKKDEWECVVKKDDFVVSVHIPRKTDLSPEAVQKSYDEAREIVRKRFPEYDARYFFCLSWILDVRYKDILGEDSKMVQFANTFSRIPMKCRGRDGSDCVFLGYKGPDENLPENTSLQRKLKSIYLSGGYTYSAMGVITDYPIR